MKLPKSKSVRLSKNVVPERYDLQLRPDLENFTFEGVETISIQILKATKTLTLHSKEIEILTVSLEKTPTLKEKLTNISYGALGLAFIGLLMVYWGDIRLDYLDQALPVLASIVAGSFFSIWFVFSKKISHKYATVQLNTYGYVFAVTVNILIASFLGESININFFSTAWLANLGYGVVGFAGSGLAVYGFKFIEAHKGSVVLLSEILFGMIFGFMLFGEVLNIITLLGGSLILIASALPHVLQLGRTEAT